MAKPKYSLDYKGFLDAAYELDELGGIDALKRATENALVKSGEYATLQMAKAMHGSKDYHFKKGEHYSQGGAKEALKAASHVGLTWNGTVAEMPVGFDLAVDADILFAIYGTPHKAPDKNLYRAVKIKGTYAKDVAKIQKQEFDEVLKEYIDD